MSQQPSTDETVVREILRAERAQILARIRATQEDLDAIVLASYNANADDEHDPEGSTIAYERAQVAALLAAAESSLGDVDRALSRLTEGQYALCERLVALPAGRTCFECANRS
jgi:DnaK suppressor protein